MLLGSITEVKGRWRDGFEDGEREELDRGLRAKTRGSEFIMVDAFSRSWLCDLFVYPPLYADRRKTFADDGDSNLLRTGAAFVVANSSKLLANQ